MHFQLGSFEILGLSNDSDQPVLLHLMNDQQLETQQTKLFEINFEINPLDKKADYCLKVASHSFQIKYDAVRTNVYINSRRRKDSLLSLANREHDR